MTRRPHDKYDTPYAPLIVAPLVEFLGESLGWGHIVLEPCAGDGNLADALTEKAPWLNAAIKRDINQPGCLSFNATSLENWEEFRDEWAVEY